MVLGMKKKTVKAPPVVRNQAVQAVGVTYFRVAMVGLVAAVILSVSAIALGSKEGLFEFNLDRCDCLLTSSDSVVVESAGSCVYGEDHLAVDIGWKSFIIQDANSREGCLDGWEGTTDIGTPFGDGIYRKKTTTYGNGATGAADAAVALFVVSGVVAIITYKTFKMSYTGPGSIYSIGLHNISIICLLLSVASFISIAAFWGRVQGKLGTMGDSLASTLYKAVIDVCEDDWDEANEGDTFCETAPWTFEMPLYAGIVAISHVSVMFLISCWILSKSAFVEGILDGSVLTTGKAVEPRMVEYEQAVGRALATTEDPDYDGDNKLYTGDANIMIRPYPLPTTAIKKIAYKAASTLVSPLRSMSPGGKFSTSGKAQTSKGDVEASGSPKSDHTSDTLDVKLSGSPDRSGHSPVALPVPAVDVSRAPTTMTKAEEKAAAKAAKKAAKKDKDKKGKSKGKIGGASGGSDSLKVPRMPSIGQMSFGRKSSPEVDDTPRSNKSSPDRGIQKSVSANWSAVEESSIDKSGGGSVDAGKSIAAAALPGGSVEEAGSGGGRHEKTRTEIDWGSIMTAGGPSPSEADEEAYSSPLEDMIGKLPSTRDGLGLGAITEDPREDIISEFTVSPRAKGSAAEFEV